MSVDALLKEVETLSDAERVEFLERLSELYPSRMSNELSPELAKLLDERNAAYEANPDKVYTWDEVVAHVKRKK
ncbi:MAG: addiction module protein [Planctomycetes bacterium]|nr:addiction module protein [Planctomycetota bacterium]